MHHNHNHDVGEPRKMYLKNGVMVSSRSSGDFGSQYEREIGRRHSLKSNSIREPPQPACQCDDPLEWGRWRKEMAFASLMLAGGMIGSLKTGFVTVNAVLAVELSASYMATAALTGLPLIVGALFGLKSQILAQVTGKRVIYLGSAIAMLLGAVWNMHVTNNYAEFLVSRIIQGMGWGAFEALISGSISDIFHPEEQAPRMNIYRTISIFFTWGTPILGGYLSQNATGFHNEIMVINIIQAFSIVFLVLVTPESRFIRAATVPAQQNEASTFTATTVTIISAASESRFKRYLATLKLTNMHSTQKLSFSDAMRPAKAIIAPSALLTTLLTAPLMGAAFGLAQSISLLFSGIPTLLFPAHIGFLFTGPLLFSLFFTTLSSFISCKSSISQAPQLPNLIIAITGLLAFGLYTNNAFIAPLESDDDLGSLLLSDFPISLPTVSALFGLLVGGSVALSYSANAALSSPCEENLELQNAHLFLQDIIVGGFVIGMPMWIGVDKVLIMTGLRDTAVALAIVGLIVGSAVTTTLWIKGGEIRRMDEKIIGTERRDDELGLAAMGVPMQRWKTGDSGRGSAVNV